MHSDATHSQITRADDFEGIPLAEFSHVLDPKRTIIQPQTHGWIVSAPARQGRKQQLLDLVEKAKTLPIVATGFRLVDAQVTLEDHEILSVRIKLEPIS